MNNRFNINEEEKNRIRGLHGMQGLHEQNISDPAGNPDSNVPEVNQIKPTHQKPLCNNMSGTYGTGKETEFKVCVYKVGPSSYVIELRDSNDKKLFTDGGDTWIQASESYFKHIDEKYPGKVVGIDLPVPIDPELEASHKYYYEEWVKSN